MTMLTTGAAAGEETAVTGGFGGGHGSCMATSAEETTSGVSRPCGGRGSCTATSAEETASSVVRPGGGCGGVMAAGKHVWDFGFGLVGDGVGWFVLV
jgi:hypothetical protein